jgi:hypothetical protein
MSHAINESLLVHNSLRIWTRRTKATLTYENLVGEIAEGKRIAVDFTSNALYYASSAGFEKIRPVATKLFNDYQFESTLEPIQSRRLVERAKSVKPKQTAENQLKRVLRMFASLGMDPIAVDVTPPFLSDSVKIYKSFCLDLLPLTPPFTLPLEHPSLKHLKEPNRLMHPFA